jgi:hypothetical protein
MVLIHASRGATGSLDSVWDVIADINREPEFWHGTKSIKNISNTGNILERDVEIAFIFSIYGLHKFLVWDMPDDRSQKIDNPRFFCI